MYKLKFVSIVLVVIIATGCGGKNVQPINDTNISQKSVKPQGIIKRVQSDTDLERPIPPGWRKRDTVAVCMGVLCVGGLVAWATTSSPWIYAGILLCLGFFGVTAWAVNTIEDKTGHDPDPPIKSTEFMTLGDPPYSSARELNCNFSCI